MKIIYLASFKALHKDFDIMYQDINGLRDIGGDMLEVDLDPYDVIIATPPCNYYSRANYRRETSKYSQDTKHLLPEILKKLNTIKKPWIVENVRNKALMKDLYDYAPFVYFYGRHTYFTNSPFNPSNIEQKHEYNQFLSKEKRQGGQNVYNVINYWLEIVRGNYE